MDETVKPRIIGLAGKYIIVAIFYKVAANLHMC